MIGSINISSDIGHVNSRGHSTPSARTPAPRDPGAMRARIAASDSLACARTLSRTFASYLFLHRAASSSHRDTFARMHVGSRTHAPLREVEVCDKRVERIERLGHEQQAVDALEDRLHARLGRVAAVEYRVADLAAAVDVAVTDGRYESHLRVCMCA
jgi:hypothetical protein